MGSAASKLRKHLQRGDEYAVMQLYDRHSEIRKSLDPNASYGEHYGHNTPLHYAARHCMKSMIRIFLSDYNGNPNKRNADESTPLHLVCQLGARSRTVEAKLRAECLGVFLAWEGSTLSSGEKERVNLDCQDSKKCTPLHYAAQSGLKRCVEMLVCKGANLFVENENKETACDCAVKANHQDIADYLETKMLFAQENNDDLNEEDLFPVTERYSGLREQDLREAKDLLLVETSDMLHIPLFTAEALLKNHEWSRESLLDAWMRDPVSCCEKCGVQPPLSLTGRHGSSSSSIRRQSTTADTSAGATGGASGGDGDSVMDSSIIEDDDPFSPLAANCGGIEGASVRGRLSSSSLSNVEIQCEICTETTPPPRIVTSSECGHRFCRDCWKSYVSMKVQDGEFHGINCPAYACSKLVSLDLIEQVLSPQMARKFLKFDIKAFVESNPRIKWCPFPGCTNAVRLPDAEEQPPVYLRAFPMLQPPPATSRTVYCPNSHAFCWDCSSDGHEPTSCEKWKDWHVKISEVRPEELKDTTSTSETAANCLWLVTHSKPCPKCKSPIQKNEGCNHMKCSKCKHDFCWVCLGPWKKHSSDTGGYFRCNRYEETRKMDEKTESAIAEAKEQSKKAQELNRFVHYYSRYKNHLNSFELEKPLLDNITSKINSLTKVAPKESEETVDMSFIRDAIQELLRSRKVLSSSYAYGYFLKDCGYNKTIFEYLQNELEVSVETLSGLVGRHYLRGSRKRITATTQLVASRRHRFLVCISRGLLPPETPPNARKGRRRHLPAILGLDKDDDDWVKTGIPKVDEFDPSRPWVKDSRGRYHNLLAILDWPEEESEDEETSRNTTPSTSPPEGGGLLCERRGCERPRAKNPRTGTFHSHCSLKCRYVDTLGDEGDISGPSTSGTTRRQYNVDLMIALQMSRLQLLQDLRLLSDDNSTPSSPNASSGPPRQQHHQQQPPQPEVFADDVDPDLQLAIERSMMELAEASSRRESNCSDIVSASFDRTEAAASASASASSRGTMTVVDPYMLSSYFKKVVDKEYSIANENLCSTNPCGDGGEDEDSSRATAIAKAEAEASNKVHKILLKSMSGGGGGNRSDPEASGGLAVEAIEAIEIDEDEAELAIDAGNEELDADLEMSGDVGTCDEENVEEENQRGQ